MSAMLWTNILSLEAEHRGLNMALIDNPPPRKKAKLEEQMRVIGRLRSELSDMVATPLQSNLRSSPRHDDDSMNSHNYFNF